MSSTGRDCKDMKKRYTKILEDNGITKEIKEIIVVKPELKGEHMASVCEYLIIKFTDDSENLELFIKRLANNTFSQVIKAMGFFEKEATFFNQLLPSAKAYCREKTGTDWLIDFFPKPYYGDDSLIVLENLTKKGYFMLDKIGRLNFSEARFVLGNLAKFHGVFYSMINDLGEECFSETYPQAVRDPFLSEHGKNIFGPMFENNINNVIRILEASSLDGSEKTVKWIKQFCGKMYEEINLSIQNGSEDSLLVLNHGDCWSNNMMFQKGETGELTHHLFVDLQVIRYGSPNLDIGYFLFTSVKPEVRRKYLEKLLKFYFDALRETVNEFGFFIDLSFDDFLKNYSRKCTLGFWMELIFTSAIGVLKEIDLEKCGGDLDEVNEYFKTTIVNWFDSNPDEAKRVSKEIIDTVEEYIELSN